MKKTVLLLAAALAACGSQKTDLADSIRAALPAAQAIRIDAPNPVGAAGAAALTARHGTAMTSDGKADLAVVSYLYALGVNVGVGLMLTELELVTLLPPTSCTSDSCTWGPGSSPTDLSNWKLVVTKVGDGYQYELSAQPKSNPSAPFVKVIDGTAIPGPQPRHGKGTLNLYFDNEATLPHPADALGNAWRQTSFGTMQAAYDANGPLSLQVAWLDAKNDDKPGTDPANPNRVNAAYDFEAAAQDLQIAGRTLPPYSASYIQESMSLHTRWNAAGAGRGDFYYENTSATFHQSQCWDGAPSYAETYDSLPTPVFGSAAACVFPDAVYATIVVP